MSDSATLKVSKREKVGSRDSRKLRSEGRIPCSLQSNDEQGNINFHMSSDEFATARRAHVHLFDLDIDGAEEAAIVREIQWDLMGDNIVHVEFRRVVRGVEIDSTVTLVFLGHVKEGVFTQIISELTIKSIPSMIPDSIEVKIEGLNIGDHLHAKDLVLPEGCSLGVDPDTEIAVVSAPKAEAEGPEGDGEGDGEGELGGDIPPAPAE